MENQESLPKPELDLPLPEKEITSRSQPTPKKGFNKRIFAIAVVLVLLIAGGASAYFILMKPTPKTPAQTVVKPTPTPDATASWKTYTNDGYGYEIKYPTDWNLPERHYQNHRHQNGKRIFVA